MVEYMVSIEEALVSIYKHEKNNACFVSMHRKSKLTSRKYPLYYSLIFFQD